MKSLCEHSWNEMKVIKWYFNSGDVFEKRKEEDLFISIYPKFNVGKKGRTVLKLHYNYSHVFLINWTHA